MTVVLGIRHAEVENPENVVYGHLPGFSLSAHGRRAAEALGARLAPAPVTAVYASPLERARETAEALARPHGLPVAVDERLLEWAFWSRWQGLPWTRIRERDQEFLSRYADDPRSACPEDPLDRVGERVLAWATEVARRHPRGILLGVSHQAPLAAALLVGRAEPLSRFAAVDIPHLGTVRLLPEPPEMVDPVEATREYAMRAGRLFERTDR